MDSKFLKKRINESLLALGFERKKNVWLLKRRREDCSSCAILLDESKWGNTFQVYVKIFIDGIFDNPPDLSRMHLETADILRGLPSEFMACFDLEQEISDDARIACVEDYFVQFLSPIIIKARSIEGILELESLGLLTINPTVKFEIQKLQSQS